MRSLDWDLSGDTPQLVRKAEPIQGPQTDAPARFKGEYRICADPECLNPFFTLKIQRKYCTKKCQRRVNYGKYCVKVVRDKELARAVSREWRLMNPNRASAHAHRRRARVHNAEGSHTPAEWMARVDQLGWKCHWCGVDLAPETLTKDHMVALAAGGSNYAENLVPSCLSCNISKGKKSPTAFRTYLKQKQNTNP